jgi:IS30 family transposase
MTNKHQRQLAIRALRGKMWSPGRPTTARRENRVRFWEAIARGLSSEDAAAEAGVASAVGTRWFREAGGMPSLTLAPMSGRYLSFAEREEMAILHAQQLGVREIARRIGRAPSTISRELRRNASTRSNELAYRATTAQWHAERRASRPKVAKLAANDRLRDYVQDRLAGTIARADGELVSGPDVRFIGRRHGRRADRRWAKAWSPEQISNRLRVDLPDDESMRISHEAIYQALYVQGRGALKRELVACLRTGRALRVPRARTRGRGKKFVTPEIMISERPAEAADRAVPGHWEGDLILGLNRSAIGTLVERTTRFAMLLRLPPMDGHGLEPRTKNGPALAGHGAEAVRDAIVDTITTLPVQLRRSLTWDQGAEMAQHAQLRIDTGLAIYFCDPQSPWQRGTNENTNGLLRQYFPKGTDLARHSRGDLDAVALALNTRPRKTLGWKTPAEALDELLRSA